MSDPYRDQLLECPACKAALRTFHERLCCDSCNGIFLTVDDLARSIAELTAVQPELHFLDRELGERACPRCKVTMREVRLDVVLENHRPKLRPELDRCAAHGVWFDELELAKIFETLHAAIWPPGYGKGGYLNLGKTKF